MNLTDTEFRNLAFEKRMGMVVDAVRVNVQAALDAAGGHLAGVSPAVDVRVVTLEGLVFPRIYTAHEHEEPALEEKLWNCENLGGIESFGHYVERIASWVLTGKETFSWIK